MGRIQRCSSDVGGDAKIVFIDDSDDDGGSSAGADA
jgi:hypothetical protein